jgi:hypothetical protein
MAELGIFEKPPQEYVQFDEDTEVLIEYLPPDELKDETRAAEKIAKRARVEVNDILLPRIAERCVKHWRKITDHKHPGFVVEGNPIEFNKANLLLLVKRSYEFKKFINEFVADELFFLKLVQERKRKNSGGPSGGNTETAGTTS